MCPRGYTFWGIYISAASVVATIKNEAESKFVSPSGSSPSFWVKKCVVKVRGRLLLGSLQLLLKQARPNK